MGDIAELSSLSAQTKLIPLWYKALLLHLLTNIDNGRIPRILATRGNDPHYLPFTDSVPLPADHQYLTVVEKVHPFKPLHLNQPAPGALPLP
jgi:hypothetical protein